jgi:hypothetical protein
MQWLGRHPRFIFHFTLASAPWLNAVGDFFAKLIKWCLKHGVFHSLVALQAAINRFMAEAYANLRPFHWTKDTKKIAILVEPSICTTMGRPHPGQNRQCSGNPEVQPGRV